MSVEKTSADAVKTGAKIAETIIRKAWSILDAASEKRMPSESLSKQAIKAIQGRVK